MHYQDGTEVKIGDLARNVTKPEQKYTQIESVGVVVSGVPDTSSCNLQLQVFAQREIGPLGASQWRSVSYPNTCCFTAGECVKVVD